MKALKAAVNNASDYNNMDDCMSSAPQFSNPKSGHIMFIYTVAYFMQYITLNQAALLY